LAEALSLAQEHVADVRQELLTAVTLGSCSAVHAVAVYAHAVQHDDGRIDNGSSDPVFEPPGISMLTIDDEHGRPTDIGVTLTGAAARRLADVLVTAADELDGWSAR
jgi:hypothetical protein